MTDRDDGAPQGPDDFDPFTEDPFTEDTFTKDPVTEQAPVIPQPVPASGSFHEPTPPFPAQPIPPSTGHPHPPFPGPAQRAEARQPQRPAQPWVAHARPPAPSAASHRPGEPPAAPRPPVRPHPEAPWTAPQPATYAERIRPADLVPHRKVLPGSGWRRALYKATFGLINLGPSPQDKQLTELETAIRRPLRGNFKIGVMGKGGVGKTTVSASLGSVLAESRQDVRVVAVDADTAFGKLGSRVDPQAQGSFWELAADQHLETFADVRNRLGCNAAGLFVLAGEATPARRRVLDPAIYREALSRLDRHFTLSVIDCSSTMDSPVTQEVLRDLDALVVVSSPWVDGAAAAGQTLDWLAARGMTSLLQRTVVVLNDSDGHADKRTKRLLAQQFSGNGQQVIEIPFDGNLRPGGVIDGSGDMSPAARRKFVEVAAALAAFFPAPVRRSG
ncbi:MinD/ParA family ATP-binding protein [Mycobacterium sp. smrl_JER01]|uniref:MinD/ParA family ATP-binding protein n=1 Tax=Mycobacterium sp. smrl_JER01 TaxID=3402633 RepID=UPI003AC6AB8A